MAANINVHQLTVLSDIPKFSGNPKPGETASRPGIDARTFLRTLENYFRQHNITSDDRKLQILYAHIEPTRGDAMNFMNCFVGRSVSFERVKRDFLGMYPSFKVTDFRHAATAYLETKVESKNVFVSLTALEIASKASAEAYLRFEPLNKGRFNDESYVHEDEPPAEDEDEEDEPGIGPITLVNLLQNYSMHLMLGHFIHPRIYEKFLASLGPDIPSTSLMAETVKQVERHKLTAAPKTQVVKEETIWRAQNHPAQSSRPPTPSISKAPPQSNSQDKPSKVTCYNCGKDGHVKRDCKSCTYCKKYGHAAKECRTRIAQAKGKYCNFCRLKDSHSTQECRRKQNTGKTNVRMIEETEDSDDWSDPVCEVKDDGAVRPTSPDNY